MICPRCNHDAEGARCVNCGANLGPQAPLVWFAVYYLTQLLVVILLVGIIVALLPHPPGIKYRPYWTIELDAPLIVVCAVVLYFSGKRIKR